MRATAAPATASCAVANTAWNPSPVVLTTTPPCDRDRVPQQLVVARQRVRASPSGYSSHSRVEPSTSVNRNVTVPDGSSAVPAALVGDPAHPTSGC